jgi:hypothetical protein
MRIPGFNDPLKISLRSSSARLFFTRPTAAGAEVVGMFKRSNMSENRILSN